MKKLINSPDNVIADALKGIAASDKDVRVDFDNRVIYRATPKEAGKVAIISGGGSGHEPMHGGYGGVGATVLLEKIVGAAAEEGADLAAVAALAQKVADNGRSMGMALTSCTVPSAGKPTFDLPDNEIEIGIGIHGEPGRHREPIADAHSIAEQLVAPILSDLDFTGAPVIAMLNGMGATPLIELYLMYGEVIALFEEAGVTVERNLVGNYITSLDMAGCSLTLVRADDELIRLWDAPVRTAGLRWGL